MRADVAKRGRDQRCVGAGQRVEAIAAETWPARLPSARRAECLRCRAGGGGVERVLHERRRSKVPRRLARRAGDQRAIKIPGATTAPVVLLPARALDRSAQEVTRYTEIGPRSARDRPAIGPRPALVIPLPYSPTRARRASAHAGRLAARVAGHALRRAARAHGRRRWHRRRRRCRSRRRRRRSVARGQHFERCARDG